MSSSRKKIAVSQIFTPRQYLEMHTAMHQLRASSVSPDAIADSMDIFIRMQKSPNEKIAEPRRRFAEMTKETAKQVARHSSAEEREFKTTCLKSSRVILFGATLFGRYYNKSNKNDPLLQTLQARKALAATLESEQCDKLRQAGKKVL